MPCDLGFYRTPQAGQQAGGNRDGVFALFCASYCHESLLQSEFGVYTVCSTEFDSDISPTVGAVVPVRPAYSVNEYQ